MTTSWRERIVCDPQILVGKPTIKGTRISVELILDRVADGWSRQDLRDSYPHLTEDDLNAAFAFSAEVVRDKRCWTKVGGK